MMDTAVLILGILYIGGIGFVAVKKLDAFLQGEIFIGETEQKEREAGNRK